MHTLYASLRAAEVYIRLLIDRIEAPRATDRAAQLTDVPAGVFVGLTSASDSVQDSIARFLGRLDPSLARRAEAIADLAQQSARTEPDR